jgi:hypothetical protein
MLREVLAAANTELLLLALSSMLLATYDLVFGLSTDRYLLVTAVLFVWGCVVVLRSYRKLSAPGADHS